MDNRNLKILGTYILGGFGFAMFLAISYIAGLNQIPRSLALLGSALIFIAIFILALYLWQETPAKPNPTSKERRLVTMKNFSHPMLEDAILDTIRLNLSLHGDGIAVIGQKKDALLVKWIIDNQYIPGDKLRRAVHDGICQAGREMFEWCRASPLLHRPDHVLCPAGLGYAMKHGAISSEEVALLRFDHYETPEEYIALSRGLLDKVIKQLAEGTAFFDLSFLGGHEADDGHCCCGD